jgi:hypothetical protein
MNSKKLSGIFHLLKLANALDSNGQYKQADILFNRLANYNVEQSQLKTKDISYFEWDETTDEQFQDNNEAYIEKKPNLLQKEYFNQGDGTDPAKKDELSQEGLLNGPSGVTGPAYIDPGNVASSPSMGGGNLEQFEWKNIRNEDHPEYDRIPLR